MALGLSACGSRPVTVFEVNMVEFTFTPSEFTIPAGQEITITAVNSGAIEHDFVILKHGTKAGDTFDGQDEENIFWELEVGPGNETTASFTAPQEAGEYQIVCGVEGHYIAGMVGTLIVVEP